jgi:tRNA(Ile)-lysidine synthase
MKTEVPTGKYIVAVSGGVDSMALLDMLSHLPNLELIVAHFNHGIRRTDSAKDQALVSKAAKAYKLPVEVGHGYLKANASEDLARQKRYEFLYKILREHNAKKIITAHHQDDLIETAFLNILRGSGSRGIVSIANNTMVLRPLLNTPKSELVNYAIKHNLKWREDNSNSDVKYLRNNIRAHLSQHLTNKDRKNIVNNLDKIAEIHVQKQELLATISHNLIIKHKIYRSKLNLLPVEVANEIILEWLRNEEVKDVDRKTIERLNIALRTALPGTIHPVKGEFKVMIGAKSAQLTKTS